MRFLRKALQNLAIADMAVRTSQWIVGARGWRDQPSAPIPLA